MLNELMLCRKREANGNSHEEQQDFIFFILHSSFIHSFIPSFIRVRENQIR